MNYFELYQMPVSLTTDKATLKKTFYELSRRYHPDFFTGAPQEEQAAVLDMSSMVNKGFKVLQNDDETIKYVLQLKGLLVEEEKYELPPDFLMEMLELSEQMMEARMEGDEAAMAAVQQQIENVQTEIYEPVKGIVEHYKEGITTEKELLQVKEYYYKKKYLTRILAGMN